MSSCMPAPLRLDDAAALTSDAQGALRRIMEQFAETCRFILSCNYSSKIVEAIQSRCAGFRFRPLDSEKVLEKVMEVEQKSGVMEENTQVSLIMISCTEMELFIILMEKNM